MAVTMHSTRVQGLSLPDRPRQPRVPCRVPTNIGPCLVLCQHPARGARALTVVEATAQMDGAVHEGSRTKRSHMQAQSGGQDSELETAAASAMSAWLAGSGCDLPPAALAMHMETSSLAWADGRQPAGELVVAGTILPDAHGTRTAVVALAARLDSAAPGMNNNLDDVQLRAHWACTTGQGRGWKPPPSGWHTEPAESSDAGGGAWQTTLPKTGDMRTMVLQIPLTGPLERHGSGLALVFNTSCGHWLKQSMEHGGVGDVFYPTDSMPSVDEKRLSGSGPQGAAAPASSTGSESGKSKETKRPEASQPAQQPAQPKLKARTATPVAPQVASLGVTDGAALDQFIAKFTYVRRKADEIAVGGNIGHKIEPCGWMVDNVGNREPGAQRSLMHRYNEATELADGAAAVGDWNERLAAVCGLAVWLRFSAMRLLTWNRNYNVKPREISAAQDRLCTRLCELWAASGRNQGPEVRPLVRLALSSVGRGGQGDVGQRVRDEILVVQQKNNCKGGMMEEWHQKLHNNTSPDDVVICEALIAYCNSGLDMSVYWKHLHENNIDANRLASYDRAIRNEPRFSQDQVPGLVKDLTAYLHTLRAVHCGTDLASAAGNVLGYKAQDLMKGNRNVNIEPVPNVATQELRMLLAAALQLQHVLQTGGSKNSPQGVLYGTTRLIELLGEARHMIRHAVLGGDSTCGGRHRDVVFLDIALEGATRSALEAAIGPLRDSAKAVLAQPPNKGDADFVVDYQDSRDGKTPTGLREGSVTLLESLVPVTPGKPAGEVSSTQRISLLLEATSLAVESATLSSYPNEELSLGIKWLSVLHSMKAGEQQRDRALLALSAIDRLKRTLDTQSSALASQLQPTAWAMGQRLGLPEHAINIFSEEAVRGTAVAPLSQLLGVVEPCLRRLVGSGEWQVVSRGPAERQEGVVGVVVTQSRLEDVQYKTYDRPTVLVVDILQGHEEVPEGCVAVISANGQCPDMLSHSAVRARNMDVLLAACYNEQAADRVRHMNGQQVRVQLMGQEVKITNA